MQKSNILTIDLAKVTLPQITAFRTQLDNAYAERQREDMAAKLKRFAGEAGMSLDTIQEVVQRLRASSGKTPSPEKVTHSKAGNGHNTPAPKVAKTTKGKTVPVKFRDQEGHTWTGRGMAPKWLQAAEKAGHPRDEFRISA